MDDNHIQVSVIIPVYNVEEYIAICIESVLAQNFTNIEIIVVNDKSPDKSGAIIAKYAKHDKRIVHIEHKKNAGVGAARNTGIAHAKGKFIYFVDGDDFLHQDAIKCLYEKIQNRDDLDMVIAGFIPVEDKGYTLDNVISLNIDVIKDRHYAYPKNIEIQKTSQILAAFGTMPMKDGILAPMWNKLYRKNIFTDNNIKFLPGVHTEDLATMPKILLKAKKVLLIKETFYFYRMRENSALSKEHTSLPHITALIDSHIKSIQSVKEFFIQEKCFVLYKDVLSKMISSNLYQIVINSRAPKNVRREALALFFEYCAKEIRDKHSLIDETLYGDICLYALSYPNINVQSAKRWVFFASLPLGKKIIFFIRWILVSPKYIFKKHNH